MKLRVFLSLSEYLKRFEEWRPWFAWHPIFVDGELVWLEAVERKRASDWGDHYWKYRFAGVK